MKTNSSRVCPRCTYDANRPTATHCEVCGYPLVARSGLQALIWQLRSLTNWWLVLLFLLALVAGGGYFLWQRQRQPVPTLPPSQPSPSRPALRMLGSTFSGYSPFRSSALRTALAKVGIDFQYEKTLDSIDFAQKVERLNQGEADFLLTTLDQFLLKKPQGKIVGLMNRSVGGDAVVLNTKRYPGLVSLLELDQLVRQNRLGGRELGIVYAGDSASEYLALLLNVKFESFQLADFQRIEVPNVADAFNLLQDPSRNIAIAVLWEPDVTRAQQQGYTVVLSSKDTPGAIVHVIVASDRLIKTQPENVTAFLEAYYRLIEAGILEPSQLKDQIAADGALSPIAANTVLQGLEFFTARVTQEWMNKGILDARILSTAAILKLTGRLDKVLPAPKALYTDQFMTKAANNTQALINLVRASDPDLADQLAGKGITSTPGPAVSRRWIQTAPSIGNLRIQGTISFGFATADLTDSDKSTLNRLAAEIAEFNPQTVAVRVIGHASKPGSAQCNQALSQKRAQVVANYLRRRGLKHQIVAEGKGASEPLPGIPAGDSRNQRTEIRLVRIRV